MTDTTATEMTTDFELPVRILDDDTQGAESLLDAILASAAAHCDSLDESSDTPDHLRYGGIEDEPTSENEPTFENEPTSEAAPDVTALVTALATAEAAVEASAEQEELSPLEPLLAIPTDEEAAVGIALEVLEIDPNTATRLWDESSYGAQRDKRMNHVRNLADEMSAGRWVKNSVLKAAYSEEDAEWYLVDGQSRLHAVAISGTTQTFAVVKYILPTAEDVSDLYVSLDNGLPRRLRDTLKAKRFGSTHTLTIAEQEKVGTAIRGLLSGGDGVSSRTARPIPHAVMIPLIDRLAVAARIYFDAITHEVRKDKKGNAIFKVNRTFLAGPMIQVGILAALGEADKATEFFKKASQEYGHEKGDATAALYNWTQKHGVDDTKTGVYARIVAECYNAFFDGKPLDKPTDTKKLTHTGPFRVAGSPFDGVDRYVLNSDTAADAPLFIEEF